MTEAKEHEFAYWAEAFRVALLGHGHRPSERQSKQAILEKHLLPALGPVRLDALGAEIAGYKRAKLAAGLSKKTINNHLSVLRRVLSWAEAAGAPFAAPRIAGFALRTSEPPFLDANEARRLLAAVDDDFRNMVLLALRAGLRLSELLALRWSDVDLERRSVRVERALVRGLELDLESGRRRELPLAPSVAASLAQQPRRGPWVFSAHSDAPLAAGACKWPLYRAARRAGLGRIGWRALSNSFARELTRRGAPESAVHALLGTKAATLADRAASPTLEELERAVALLELRDVRSAVEWRRAGARVEERTRQASAVVIPLRVRAAASTTYQSQNELHARVG